MATFVELFDILSFNVSGAKDLSNRVGVATLITAYTISAGNDDVAPFDQTAGAHEKRLVWANDVFQKPRGSSKDVFVAVVSANSTATQANILSASDAAIQSSVNAIVDTFAVALGPPPS